MSPIDLIFLLAGLIFGALLALGFLRTKYRGINAQLSQNLASAESDLDAERERRAILEGENRRIPSLETEIDLGRDKIISLQEDLNIKIAERAAAKAIADEVPTLKRILESADQKIRTLGEENVELRTAMKAQQENAARELAMLDEAKVKMTDAFGALSRKTLQENNQSFIALAEQTFSKLQQGAQGDLEKRQQAISDLLTPLATKISDFESKVDQVYRTEAAERNSLRGEIKNLVELNQQLSKEANNLAVALKGDTKKQGNWGELICEKILEYSGLRKGEEYKIQVSMQDEEGRRLQPDIIVYLPDGKHIVIDSKVSLVAYNRYVAADSDEARASAQAEHIVSVRRHIKDLSDKKYPSLPDLDSPDFTLLFMPIESSFGMAIQADNELFSFAWDRKIVMVSPSTLLATLRTISALWKQERQTRNALKIAESAGKMYDKFVGFIEDLTNVGRKINDVKSGYEDAMKKLHSGSGNLVRQSEQLRELGAKATKALPQGLLDRSSEDVSNSVAAGPAITNVNAIEAQQVLSDSGPLFSA